MLPYDEPAQSRADVVRIPMRDGVTLVGDLYRPRDDGRYPVIVEVTPYGRRSNVTFVGERDFWTARGYAFLIIDARGLHDSGGTFRFMHDAVDDGYDLVQWAGGQPWSTGNVGMRGSSYSGTYPWYAAQKRPPALKCINPNASAARGFSDVPYTGGGFKIGWALPWFASLANSGVKPGTPVDWGKVLAHRPLRTADEAAFGVAIPAYREVIDHPTLDSFWQPTEMGPAQYRKLTIPSLAFSAWFDGTLPGTINSYRQMKAVSHAARDQFLIVGPWEHLTAPDGGFDYLSGQAVRQVGALSFPETAFLPGQQITASFFDWCLKGGSRPTLPSAKIYVTGTNRWLDLPDYPARPAKPVAMYLAAAAAANGIAGGGALRATPPSLQDPDRYEFDPARPASSFVIRDGRKVPMQSTPIDISLILNRPDVLVYTGPALDRAMTVVGNVRLVLYAASSARDTDFHAQIEDVAPDGRAVKLGPQNGGFLRARYRGGFDAERPMPPGSVQRYDLDLLDIGHSFLPGHRIRVSIDSSDWPFRSVNPGTGNPVATDTAEPVSQQQTIFHDQERPSHLILPVLPE